MAADKGGQDKCSESGGEQDHAKMNFTLHVVLDTVVRANAYNIYCDSKNT